MRHNAMHWHGLVVGGGSDPSDQGSKAELIRDLRALIDADRGE